MNTRPWFGMLVVILALAPGSGQSQAYTPQTKAAPIQASARWFTGYVDQPGDVGAYASIAFDPGNGTPWISYYATDVTALRVAHYVGSGGNCGPANDWYCETVDNSGNVGTYSSIDVHPDLGPPPLNTRRVGVSYYDAGVGALKFAEYSDQAGTWTVVTVQDADYMGAPSYGQYASMKYNAAGDPLIAYYTSSTLFDDELRYAYQVPSGGNCGVGSAAGLWHCETVDSGDQVGKHASLDYSAYIEVFIAYYDGGAGDLKYAYNIGLGGNCGTGNTWYCTTVDGTDGSDVGQFVSLHVPTSADDALQFAYYDTTYGILVYARDVPGSNGNCGPGNGFQCSDIEAVGAGPNAAISLAVDSSRSPLIAYGSVLPSGPSHLKAAQPTYALGLPYGNCGPLANWQCTTVDPGGDYEAEAAYASIAFAPNQLAMIAYSEWSTLSDTYDLKIAYQRVVIYLPVIARN